MYTQQLIIKWRQNNYTVKLRESELWNVSATNLSYWLPQGSIFSRLYLTMPIIVANKFTVAGLRAFRTEERRVRHSNELLVLNLINAIT